MDYDKASEFEINKAVAGYISDCFAMKMKDRSSKFNYIEMEQDEEFNPCNNWADAGLIITDNGIGIYQNHHGAWESECAIVDGNTTTVYGYEDKNPLRAVCIVFLKLKEPSNETNN